jgi:hypothetical protein
MRSRVCRHINVKNETKLVRLLPSLSLRNWDNQNRNAIKAETATCALQASGERLISRLSCVLPTGHDRIPSSASIGYATRGFGARQPLQDPLSVSGHGPNIGPHGRWTFNPGVVGSNPTGPSTILYLNHLHLSPRAACFRHTDRSSFPTHSSAYHGAGPEARLHRFRKLLTGNNCGQMDGSIRTIESEREVIEDVIAEARAVVESSPSLIQA